MAEIRKIAPGDFPQQLAEIIDPPKALYLRGSLPPPDHKLLTVVGSRKMSTYGKDACEYLIQGLAGYPITIVSGLALGIDAVAHRAALAAGLQTLALPGSGVNDDVLYPASHRGLAKEIIAAGGGIMSEFEPDAQTMLHFFPQRNRIMAGISHAVLIVEAGLKSGTLITAKLATEYNRELLIVPHSIFSEGGAGGHIFMKLGAAPVRSPEDIFDVLGIKKNEVQKELLLNQKEKKLLDLLSSPLSRDELIRELGVPTGEANVLIASMELRGLITESLGELRRGY